ncbi:MAG: hypothetical protein ACJAVA_000348 [Flavobacteriaceae bacterium]|jgi:hypothetical protein
MFNKIIITILIIEIIIIVIIALPIKNQKTIHTQKTITYLRKDGTFLIEKDNFKVMESFKNGNINIYQ